MYESYMLGIYHRGLRVDCCALRRIANYHQCQRAAGETRASLPVGAVDELARHLANHLAAHCQHAQSTSASDVCSQCCPDDLQAVLEVPACSHLYV